MEFDDENLSFLPYLIHEEIYLIPEKNAPSVPTEQLSSPSLIPEPAKVMEQKVVENIPVAVVPQKETIVPKTDAKIEENKLQEPLAAPSATKTDEPILKKIVILVGYQGLIPKEITEGFKKIFAALQIEESDLAVVNVLDSAAFKIERYTFSYLLLMGGNGKNLDFLKDYTGQRARYEIGNHRGAKIYFAEAMDIYLKPENIELKKKFWANLKMLFDLN